MNFTSMEVIHHDKVSIIGSVLAGMACAIPILLEGLSDALASVDVESKLQGETVDLKRGSPFVNVKSNLGIITASANQEKVYRPRQRCRCLS